MQLLIIRIVVWMTIIATIVCHFAHQRKRAAVVVNAFRSFTSLVPSRKAPAAVRRNHHRLRASEPATSARSSMSSTINNTNNGEATSYPTEMTNDEKYLFDLNGYLIVRNVLTSEQVQEANMAINAHEHEMVSRDDTDLRNAKLGSPLYGNGPGRKDLGRVLEWGKQQSRVFKSILAHPRLIPIFHEILGKGYHLDHLPFVIASDVGGEGFSLHGGTIDCTTGEYNPHLAYTCQHNTIRTALLGCNVMLTDHNAGDGGFCIVPGSHKSNFHMPTGMIHGEEQYSEYIRQPVTKAGDVILFSEGTVHGALPWTPKTDTNRRQRRCCLYRFAPATNVYGRSYFGHNGTNNNIGWPEGIYNNNDLTEAERAVLEPPYANRLDRPNIQSDGETVVITSRNPRKKQHDQDVFGTKYF